MSGVVLVTPPVTTACEPEPGVLALAGYLRERAIPVALVDANLGFHEALFSPGGASPPTDETGRRKWGRAVKAFQALRDPATYRHAGRFRAANGSFQQGMKLMGRAMGVALSASDFVHPALSGLASEDLAALVAEPERLATMPLLAAMVEQILAHDPAVVGVSVSYLSQALHGFALAGRLRERGYGGLLLMGGGLVTSWEGALTGENPVFSGVDALVFGPGERVVEAAWRTGGVPDLPGVLAPRAGVARRADYRQGEALSFSPTVDGVPWERYLAPGGILPLSASRGCYWARCAFCPEAGEDHRYHPGPVEAMVARILDARDRYGVRHVHFTDNALSPAHLRKLARALRGQGVSWYGFARLEKSLEAPSFHAELADGGCAMLQLGIETASDRLNAFMGKGIDIARAGRVVRAAHEAGIRVFGYFLFGAPSETEAEAAGTLRWLAERAAHFTCVNLSIMNLPREGIIHDAPGAYGVDAIRALDERNDLTLYWGFTGVDTLDRRAIRRLLSEAKRDPALGPLIGRTPRAMKSKHAAFAAL